MERYTPQEAFDEAEKLKLKVNSGEAKNYQEAESHLTVEDKKPQEFQTKYD